MMSDPKYTDYTKQRDSLADLGWVTPNTYCKLFRPITSDPAVYLFLVVRDFTFDESFVAYVGMSENLKQRMSGHPIKAELSGHGHWVMTWFMPVIRESLRDVEAHYIKHFNPPWNIAGKPKGVVLQ